MPIMTKAPQDVSPRPPATRMQKRAMRTRKRLMDAALRMFCEIGIDATSIKDITDRADLGKGTFYRHFAGKEDIVAALIEDALDHLVQGIDEARSDCSDLREALGRLLTVPCRQFLDNPDEFLVLLQARILLKLDRDEEGDLELPYTRYLGELESYLTSYTAGAVEPARIRRVAVAVAGFVSGFISFAMIGMDGEEIERSLQPLRTALVESLAALLGQGMATPPAAAQQA